MKKSVTLIELISIIVVAGIAVPPLLGLLADVTKKSVQGEKYYQATVYARDLMEKILSKRFDENTASPWSSTLGPDAGETTENRYDDVDDYNNYNDNTGGFTRKVSVNYIDPDQGEPPTGCNNGTQNYALDCFVSSIKDYKRIDITISHNLISSITISTIVSGTHQPK